MVLNSLSDSLIKRICPTHRIEIQPLSPERMKGKEVLICSICRAEQKYSHADFWLIQNEDGYICGLAGHACGGYVAMDSDEWQEIPDLIQEQITEIQQESSSLPQGYATLKEELSLREAGLRKLLVISEELCAGF